MQSTSSVRRSTHTGTDCVGDFGGLKTFKGLQVDFGGFVYFGGLLLCISSMLSPVRKKVPHYQSRLPVIGCVGLDISWWVLYGENLHIIILFLIVVHIDYYWMPIPVCSTASIAGKTLINTPFEAK